MAGSHHQTRWTARAFDTKAMGGLIDRVIATQSLKLLGQFTFSYAQPPCIGLSEAMHAGFAPVAALQMKCLTELHDNTNVSRLSDRQTHGANAQILSQDNPSNDDKDCFCLQGCATCCATKALGRGGFGGSCKLTQILIDAMHGFPRPHQPIVVQTWHWMCRSTPLEPRRIRRSWPCAMAVWYATSGTPSRLIRWLWHTSPSCSVICSCW